jgi:hypothetical protein
VLDGVLDSVAYDVWVCSGSSSFVMYVYHKGMSVIFGVRALRICLVLGPGGEE